MRERKSKNENILILRSHVKFIFKNCPEILLQPFFVSRTAHLTFHLFSDTKDTQANNFKHPILKFYALRSPEPPSISPVILLIFAPTCIPGITLNRGSFQC